MVKFDYPHGGVKSNETVGCKILVILIFQEYHTPIQLHRQQLYGKSICGEAVG
jgi:energy-converting hydrogenase Eha subunit F